MQEVKDDEDVEEGQIPASPRPASKDDKTSSPSKTSSPLTPLNSRRLQESSGSRSRSPQKEGHTRSRSRSRSRRYASRSRSRSRSRQRRRSRSRDRSPYPGPIIKDYRRGRRGFPRFPRGGFRGGGRTHFRRSHHSGHSYVPFGSVRRHEFSRSRSRSFSPKRRYSMTPERTDKRASDDEKQFADSKSPEVLKPTDIKMSQKRITQSFLAMLEEKQNRSKMVPIESSGSFDAGSVGDDVKTHGFVNTFNSVGGNESGPKHTLSYDLEKEGWQIVDDAGSESGHKKHHKSDRIHDNKDTSKEKVIKQDRKSAEKQVSETQEKEKKTSRMELEDSSSSDEETSKKKKKKPKRRKKKKKRKASSSSELSESDSEDAQDSNTSEKKKSKKKKKTSKRKKKAPSVSSSSESDEKSDKQKKKKAKKKKSRSSPSDSRSEDKVENSLNLTSDKISTSDADEKTVKPLATDAIQLDENKVKDKKKKKNVTKSSSSDSDSDSEKHEKSKKKKKKSKKKRSKKRKHESSSSSSSSEESTDSSESNKLDHRKKKKKKKSKKSKKSRKHKKEKKSEKKENKSKISSDEKKKCKPEETKANSSEFVIVYSVGDPPLEIKWPTRLIKYTQFAPSLQYSINPKVTYCPEDFRQIKHEKVTTSSYEMSPSKRRKLQSDCDSNKYIDILKDNDNRRLASEYERFMDELNPSLDNSNKVTESSLNLELRMRENLLKQFNVSSDERVDQRMDQGVDEENMTPSEKRALEKMKKQTQKMIDEQEATKRQEELSSAPMSTYYSAKKQLKSSPEMKSEEVEKRKGLETDFYNKNFKTDEISISFSERSNRTETHVSDAIDKTEEKKRAARELLERVKQKKGSSKDRDNHYKGDSSSRNKKFPHVGKINKPSNKSHSRNNNTVASITQANADSTQNVLQPVSEPMKLDMNYDYNWYYKYYLDTYALGQYSPTASAAAAAAYYSHYAMITSSDYNNEDLSNWMQQHGYILNANESSFNDKISYEGLSNDAQINKCGSDQMSISLDTKGSIQNVESSVDANVASNPEVKMEPDQTTQADIKREDVKSQVESIDSKSIVENPITNTSEVDNNSKYQQNIEVIVSNNTNVSLNIDANQRDENKTIEDNTGSPPISPFSSTKFKFKVKVRVAPNSTDEALPSPSAPPPPPPPPPPPKRPQMTTYTSTNPVTLPNGQILPPGTKQIVVHPYPLSGSYRFTADVYYDAYNAHIAGNPNACLPASDSQDNNNANQFVA